MTRMQFCLTHLCLYDGTLDPEVITQIDAERRDRLRHCGCLLLRLRVFKDYRLYSFKGSEIVIDPFIHFFRRDIIQAKAYFF